MLNAGNANVFDVESLLDGGTSHFKQEKENDVLNDPSKFIIKEKVVCSECNSSNIYYGTSETICIDCGIVIDEKKTENKPGYRIFGDAEKDYQRIHSEKQKIGRSLTTKMGGRGRNDYNGNVSPNMLVKLKRLEKWNPRLTSSKSDRQVQNASNHIRSACSALQLPDGFKDACVLFFQNFVKKEFGGDLRSNGARILDLSAAVIYKICKDRRSPYTIKEIARVFRIEPKKIRDKYLEILSTVTKEKRTIQTPIDYIPRASSQIKVNGAVTARALKLMRSAMKKSEYKRISMGKEAVGFGIAALYIACMLEGVVPQRTREVIASYTDVADTTIRKRAEEIILMLGIEDEVRTSYEKNYKSRECDEVNRLKNY